MKKLINHFIGAVPLFAVVLLAGCATVPTPLPGDYQGPPAGPGVASIKGSQTIMPTILLIPILETGFVTSIDGKPVSGGSGGWMYNIKITSGLRTLTVECDCNSLEAQADLQFDAIGGDSYVVKFNDAIGPFGFIGNSKYVDFWIVDTSTGKSVTSTVRKELAYLSDQSQDSDDSDPAPDGLADVDYGGADHARPPMHSDDPKSGGHDDHPVHSGGPSSGGHTGSPSHSGGPPSIPHNSPPSHSGGGGGNSGGHSSGGGGGGGGGGHSSGGGGGGGDGGHKK
jgi:hypothetical protein